LQALAANARAHAHRRFRQLPLIETFAFRAMTRAGHAAGRASARRARHVEPRRGLRVNGNAAAMDAELDAAVG
jgi:hypothetical protein